MSKYEPYEIIDNDRIVPIHNRGWIRNQPNVNDFSSALKFFWEKIGVEDAGFSERIEPWQVRVKRLLPELLTTRYLNPEEAFFMISGVFPEYASFRFWWQGEVFLTMRSDFGLLCILKDMEEPPINEYESAIYDHLIEWYTEIESIHLAIENEEVLLGKDLTASFQDWIVFFRSRPFDISHIHEMLGDSGSQDMSSGQSTSTIKREFRKLNTRERHDKWRKEYRSQKKRDPTMTNTMIAKKISRMDIAEGYNSETIRKNMIK